MARTLPAHRTAHIGVGRVLLSILELPAAAGALWLAWILAESNPLEEVFENSMVNFVPGALIPYLLYMTIAALGLWLVYDGVLTMYRAARQALIRRRRRSHRRR
ncbi:hypothetical protein [Tessaracoccus sp. G1721]